MNNEPGSTEVSRKKRLVTVIVVLGIGISMMIALPIVSYFLSPAWQKNSATEAVIGRVSDLEINQPQFVVYEERVKDGWYVSTVSKGVWLVTTDGKTVIGFDPRCTHLACPYSWNSIANCFQCPCHGGKFDINGNVLAGPPPRPLDRLEITIQNGQILTNDQITRG
jgi:Rieske Fe-S protein